MSKAALKRALEIAGGPTKLANALGIKPPAVSQWDQVPLERVTDVAKLTGIPAAELRPDLAAIFEGASTSA